MTNYESESAQKEALKAINHSMDRIKEAKLILKQLDKNLERIRLNLVYTRRVKFGSIRRNRE